MNPHSFIPAFGLVPDRTAFLLQHADALILRRIYIDGSAAYPGQGLREEVPAALILHEIQKIYLSIHFKLQFQSP